MKLICPIHHFSYSGSMCPFCEKERIDRLAQRYKVEETVHIENKKEREITQNDLQKLMNKFNRK